jgi:hypothetical protein
MEGIDILGAEICGSILGFIGLCHCNGSEAINSLFEVIGRDDGTDAGGLVSILSVLCSG